MEQSHFARVLDFLLFTTLVLSGAVLVVSLARPEAIGRFNVIAGVCAEDMPSAASRNRRIRRVDHR